MANDIDTRMLQPYCRQLSELIATIVAAQELKFDLVLDMSVRHVTAAHTEWNWFSLDPVVVGRRRPGFSRPRASKPN
jgi:hypothetical protein